MSLKARVGVRIREIRKLRGFTQEQLAERVERSVDAISALERGLVLPSFETLEGLAQALGVPLAEFFDGEGEGHSRERTALLARLAALARDLDDERLSIAVEQIGALAKRRAPNAK